MSTLKSLEENLTFNADGVGKEVKFQVNGVEKASISSAGAFTSTSIDATKLVGVLPAIDGSALTGLPAGGKVLQVVSYLTATQSSQTVSTVDAVVNGMSKTITPIGANSKFLVTVRWIGEVSNTWDVLFNIQMDGTRVNIDGQGRGYGLTVPVISYYAAADNSSTPEAMNMTTLVASSSVVGTPITFSLVTDTQTTATMWSNRCFVVSTANYERGTSEIIITEIGA